MDPIRGSRSRLLVGGMVFQLSGATRIHAGSCEKTGAWVKRWGDAVHYHGPHVGVSWAIFLFSVAYFGQQSWSTLVMVLPTDLFPRSVVGSVAGLVGFGGAMGGIVFGQLVGYLLDHGFGYGTVFCIAGTLHVAAFLIVLVTIP